MCSSSVYVRFPRRALTSLCASLSNAMNWDRVRGIWQKLEDEDTEEIAYTDPLPQALVLTAIVISFGMTAVVVMIALMASDDDESVVSAVMRLADSTPFDMDGMATVATARIGMLIFCARSWRS